MLLLTQIFWRKSYKIKNFYQDVLIADKNNLVLSPVHGVVREILTEPHRYVLKVEINLWGHKGFYAMLDSEVDSVETYEYSQKTFSRRKLKKLLARPKYKSMQFVFTDGNFHSSLSFINTSLSLRPSTIVMPGDRVKQGAHLGWLPTGGIVLIELPRSDKLMVKANDNLIIFKTVLMERI